MSDNLTFTLHVWQWLLWALFTTVGIIWFSSATVNTIGSIILAYARHKAREWGE